MRLDLRMNDEHFLQGPSRLDLELVEVLQGPLGLDLEGEISSRAVRA